MRRALALTGVCLAALAPSALAAPTGTPVTGNEAVFTVTGRSGTLRVELLASTPKAGGPPELRLRVLDRNDKEVARLSGVLPASALSTSSGVTTLRTRLGAQALEITWGAATFAWAASTGSASSQSDDDLAGWQVSGNGGTATVVVGKVRCHTDAVVVGSGVVFGTAGYGQPLSRGLPLGGAPTTCASPPATTLPPPPR